MNLHFATPDDFQEVYAVFKQYPQIFPHIRTDYIKRQLEKKTVIFQDGALLNFTQYSRKQKVGTITVHKGVYVIHQIANRQQGNGSAKTLLDAFVEYTQSPLILTVRKDNEKARAFYERYGFVEIGTIEWAKKTNPIPGIVYGYSKDSTKYFSLASSIGF